MKTVIRINPLYSLLLGLYTLMPLVDSMSGAFHDVYPIGQIYRIVIFIYMFVLLARNSRKEFLHVLIPFMMFIVIQYMISSGYRTKSIQDVVKLFTPIIAINLLKILLNKREINKKSILRVLNVWSIVYPLLIIIPGILGLGENAYAGIGWKGYFYAVNEISFIMSSLVMYRTWRLYEDLNIRNVLILGMSCFSIAMMGTKTGYATIVVFGVLFVALYLNNANYKKLLRLLAFLVLLLTVAMLGFEKMKELTAAIFDRWVYQRDVYSYSTIDFLTSHRLRRFTKAFSIFFEGKPWYPFIGWGFGGEIAGFPNLEMDFPDLLFRTGFFGLLYVCLFYIRKTLNVCKKNLWGLFIIMWSMALAFGAGHVIFYGQSGMMLALNCTYVMFTERESRKING